VLAAAFGLVALAAPGRTQVWTNQDQSQYTELHEPGFPIKADLHVVPAEKASIRDDDLVLGVAIGGEARAYPLNLMWRPENEALNDTLGGEPIAATWCPVAHSGVVYERSLDGKRLELGAVGLDHGVFILYDRQTDTRWSQVSGEARRGPLEGRVLRKRESTVTTWARWRALHPETTVYADPALPALRRFTEDSIARITLAGDGAVVNEDLVAGVEVGGHPRAWLLRTLARPRVVNDEVDAEPVVVFLAADAVTVRVLRRRSGGRTLTFAVAGDTLRDAETGSVWDPMTGRALSGALAGRTLEPLVVTTALWYAWRSQQPGTTIWDGR